MNDNRDSQGKLLPDSERLTNFGKFLRKTSLDEITEVFNIIKGDMAVVGPRPLLVQYLERYDENQRHRHDVRPGLTGLAQVNGRNLLSWQDKFNYDLKYISHITLLGDLKIFVKSISLVFVKRSGISSKTSQTMEEFYGNE